MPKLIVTGGAYELSSLDANRQRCVNMYYAKTEPDSGEGILQPTPGLKEMVDLGDAGPVRALIQFGSDYYTVSNNTFYKLTVDLAAGSATAVSKGTLNTSTGTVSWDINPTQIMMVDGPYGYIYTPATDTFAEITDADFNGANTVTFFDSYFFFNEPHSGRMKSTAVNDGTSVDALDVATAEGRPDNLVAVKAHQRELWAFGTGTIEIWINTANSVGFPLSRRDGAFIDRGCGARHSILKIENTLIWLDDRGFVVVANGYGYQVISTEAINQEISDYAIISDAYAWQNVDRGHVFYMITFPTAQKTWGFDLVTKTWHERAYRQVGQPLTHHLAACSLRSGKTEMVGSRADGIIYVMAPEHYDDAGTEIHRIRVTSHFDVERKLLTVNSLELPMETGKAKSTGNGSDPQITMRYSVNGGYTWSHHLDRSMGKIGEYQKPIRWNRLGAGRNWLFEFTIASPVKFTIRDALIEAEVE